VTLLKDRSGIFSGDFRAKLLPRLHISLKTRDYAVAEDRHAAVAKLFRQKRVEMIEQLRSGVLTVERLAEMVEHHEPLTPIVASTATVAESVMTVDEAAHDYVRWLDANPKKSDGTTRNAGFQLKSFQEFVSDGIRTGDRPIDAITNALVRDYQQRVFLDANRSPNSTTVYMSRIGGLFRWLQKQEERLAREQKRDPKYIYSPVDPETTVNERRSRDRVLSVDESSALLAASPEQMLFPVACGLMAGFRLNELLHLRPALDVDLDIGTLAVRKQAEWSPKTLRSVRVVPIAAQLRPILERHLDTVASESWVMPGPLTPREPMQDLTFRLRFKAIVLRAGLPYGRADAQGVTFHTLRHTFASHAVMAGVDLYTVAQLLGDSLKTVEDTYAHLSPDHKRAAIAKMNGLYKLPTEYQELPQQGAN
jgi:integrase